MVTALDLNQSIIQSTEQLRKVGRDFSIKAEAVHIFQVQLCSGLFNFVQFSSVLFCSIQWIQYNLKWNKKLPITKPNQYTDVFYVFCFSFLKAKFFLNSNPDSGYPNLDFDSDFKLLKFEFYTPQKGNSFFIKEIMMMMIMIIIIMFMIKKLNFFIIYYFYFSLNWFHFIFEISISTKL